MTRRVYEDPSGLSRHHIIRNNGLKLIPSVKRSDNLYNYALLWLRINKPCIFKKGTQDDGFDNPQL